MLLFQKFHGSNTCGSLLHRRLYVILDKSFQLLEFVGASVRTGITMRMFVDGHAVLAGGHVRDGARSWRFPTLKGASGLPPTPFPCINKPNSIQPNKYQKILFTANKANNMPTNFQ